jgi:hypothetical protein
MWRRRKRTRDDAEEQARHPRRHPRSRVLTAPAPWRVSARRIRAGGGLLAASTVIQLWGLWLDYFAPDALGEPSRAVVLAALLSAILVASIWLLAQPWRRRVMVFAVVVTTLWSALLALGLASELVGQGNPNVGLELIALIIAAVGLALLPFAEVWAGPLAAILRVAAGMTLLVGLITVTFGGAHLFGVLGNYSRGAYPVYDFRVASLLSIGVLMVVAGTLCIAAVRGLARGQRRSWDIAMGGTILLLLVAVPLISLPGQGDLAGLLTFSPPRISSFWRSPGVGSRRLTILASESGNSAIGPRFADVARAQAFDDRRAPRQARTGTERHSRRRGGPRPACCCGSTRCLRSPR